MGTALEQLKYTLRDALLCLESKDLEQQGYYRMRSIIEEADGGPKVNLVFKELLSGLGKSCKSAARSRLLLAIHVLKQHSHKDLASLIPDATQKLCSFTHAHQLSSGLDELIHLGRHLAECLAKDVEDAVKRDVLGLSAGAFDERDADWVAAKVLLPLAKIACRGPEKPSMTAAAGILGAFLKVFAGYPHLSRLTDTAKPVLAFILTNVNTQFLDGQVAGVLQVVQAAAKLAGVRLEPIHVKKAMVLIAVALQSKDDWQMRKEACELISTLAVSPQWTGQNPAKPTASVVQLIMQHKNFLLQVLESVKYDKISGVRKAAQTATTLVNNLPDVEPALDPLSRHTSPRRSRSTSPAVARQDMSGLTMDAQEATGRRRWQLPEQPALSGSATFGAAHGLSKRLSYSAASHPQEAQDTRHHRATSTEAASSSRASGKAAWQDGLRSEAAGRNAAAEAAAARKRLASRQSGAFGSRRSSLSGLPRLRSTTSPRLPRKFEQRASVYAALAQQERPKHDFLRMDKERVCLSPPPRYRPPSPDPVFQRPVYPSDTDLDFGIQVFAKSPPPRPPSPPMPSVELPAPQQPNILAHSSSIAPRHVAPQTVSNNQTELYHPQSFTQAPQAAPSQPVTSLVPPGSPQTTNITINIHSPSHAKFPTPQDAASVQAAGGQVAVNVPAIPGANFAPNQPQAQISQLSMPQAPALQTRASTSGLYAQPNYLADTMPIAESVAAGTMPQPLQPYTDQYGNTGDEVYQSGQIQSFADQYLQQHHGDSREQLPGQPQNTAARASAIHARLSSMHIPAPAPAQPLAPMQPGPSRLLPSYPDPAYPQQIETSAQLPLHAPVHITHTSKPVSHPVQQPYMLPQLTGKENTGAAGVGGIADPYLPINNSRASQNWQAPQVAAPEYMGREAPMYMSTSIQPAFPSPALSQPDANAWYTGMQPAPTPPPEPQRIIDFRPLIPHAALQPDIYDTQPQSPRIASATMPSLPGLYDADDPQSPKRHSVGVSPMHQPDSSPISAATQPVSIITYEPQASSYSYHGSRSFQTSSYRPRVDPLDIAMEPPLQLKSAFDQPTSPTPVSRGNISITRAAARGSTSRSAMYDDIIAQGSASRSGMYDEHTASVSPTAPATSPVVRPHSSPHFATAHSISHRQSRSSTHLPLGDGVSPLILSGRRYPVSPQASMRPSHSPSTDVVAMASVAGSNALTGQQLESSPSLAGEELTSQRHSSTYNAAIDADEMPARLRHSPPGTASAADPARHGRPADQARDGRSPSIASSMGSTFNLPVFGSQLQHDITLRPDEGAYYAVQADEGEYYSLPTLPSPAGQSNLQAGQNQGADSEPHGDSAYGPTAAAETPFMQPDIAEAMHQVMPWHTSWQDKHHVPADSFAVNLQEGLLGQEHLGALRTGAQALVRSSVEALVELEGMMERLDSIRQHLSQSRSAALE